MISAKRQGDYDHHLAGVSRSFAACIGELAQPLRGWVSLSYLMCRVLDTVEDTAWADGAAQGRCFLAFDRLLRRPPPPAETEAWLRRLPQPTSKAEQALVADAPALVRDVHHLPRQVGRSLTGTLLGMSAGMRRFAGQKDADGRLVFTSLRAVNRYCFVVAGIVGTLLLSLFAQATPGLSQSPAAAFDAVHFGLMLQKVNLLKDQQVDEQAGRFFVPDRAALWASLGTHARYAGRFLLRLPLTAPGTRHFCAWSLFLAAKSLPAIDKVAGGKLPRLETEELFAALRATCASNVQLRLAVRHARAQLPEARQGAGGSTPTERASTLAFVRAHRPHARSLVRPSAAAIEP